MPPARVDDYSSVGLMFTEALVSRDYPRAYAMTAKDYQQRTTLQEMRTAFEAIVPTDWQTAGPVEVVQTMEHWPDKRSSDIGWAYISISGAVYSEGVTVVVVREDETLKIRAVEFGRP